ncbi:MAG: transposase, partial [Ktedonobacterales bacterium]
MDDRERIRTTRWRTFERVFADGSSQERYLRETIFGRRRPLRYFQITTDPVHLPPETTWQLMTNLPGKIEQSVGNTFGLRTWIEYGFKQAKDELGWADFRLTDAPSIERWWELVMCAYLFVSLQAPALALAPTDPAGPVSPAAAQREAAAVWTLCQDLHLSARQQRTPWPGQDAFHQATKGRFALHSQTVQAIFRAFVGNVDTTRELRKTNPKIRYPYKDKRFYPLLWPAQAVSRERGRIVLPMGRGRPSLVFRIALPEQSGACKLVWKDGYELHVAVAASPAEATPGSAQATVDLGEIHQAAVTTNTGAALVISGRGIRSLKRRHNRALGQIARKRHRCQKGSRRDRRLRAARCKASARKRRQIRDLRHKGTRAVIAFCQQQGVG